MKKDSLNQREVDQFDTRAQEWWDHEGFFKPLHQMNPCRIQIIKEIICKKFDRDPSSSRPFEGLHLLDIGCGGGLLAEPLCRLGGHVTGIDAGQENIKVAQAHATHRGLSITYHNETAESFVGRGQTFDGVISLEVLEHLGSIPPFVKACKDLLNPQGVLIYSTLNRTPLSFLNAIVAGEYILKWLPKGTHDWRKFLRPSEIAQHLKQFALKVEAFMGMTYDPFMGEWTPSEKIHTNYFTVASHV